MTDPHGVSAENEHAWEIHEEPDYKNGVRRSTLRVQGVLSPQWSVRGRAHHVEAGEGSYTGFEGVRGECSAGFLPRPALLA
jgi:hypothetical protein